MTTDGDDDEEVGDFNIVNFSKDVDVHRDQTICRLPSTTLETDFPAFWGQTTEGIQKH